MRKGFSLPELLIALVLLNVWLLALVALGSATVRVANDAMSRSAAVAAAVNRLESLAALGCDEPGEESGAAAGPRGVRERWSIRVPDDTATQGRWHEIVDSVTHPSAGAERTIVLRLRAPC